jgi:hypothetical protein
MREIAATLYDGREINHCIPCTAPLQCADRALPIDPLSSRMLARQRLLERRRDHHAGPGDRGRLRGCWVRAAALPQIGARHHLRHRARCPRGPPLRDDGRVLGWHIGFRAELGAAGLLGNKHIPLAYLRASPAQRLALLRGLMDTDGYCCKGSGDSEFSSTNERLARGARELAISLGLKATLSTGRAKLYGKDCGPKYRVCFMAHLPLAVFRVPRKLVRQRESGAQGARVRRRYIVAVEPAPSVPVRCIAVDSPSRLYLAGEAMIATHNTRAGAEWVRAKKDTCSRIALVGETAADARDVMVEGESGLLAISPPWDKPIYNPSEREVSWRNGAIG